MSEGLKISLRSGPKRKGRSGRPVISAPRQISAPLSNSGLSSGPAPRVPEAPRPVGDAQPIPRITQPPGGGGGGGGGGGKTSDYIKRRYSTRFNDLPNNEFAPPVPSIPSFDRYESAARKPAGANTLPISRGIDDRGGHGGAVGGGSGGGGGGGGGSSGGGGAPIPVDVKALRDPKLAPDQYVATMLSDASEEDIVRYEEALQKLRARAAADLQQNIYQNRTQFIKISKEAEKLKSEMRTLRNLMADLKTNTTALRSASSTSTAPQTGGNSLAAAADASGLGAAGFSTGLSKRDKRSSVADRTALWNSQMQALYKNVEGSQKFLPMALGRHVVQNAGQWIELDNATYKSRRAMQIFLLNDHLLVASRKKRKIDGPGSASSGPMLKLVADRCWSLLDIEVIDMAGFGESVSSPGFGGGGGGGGNAGRSKLVDAIMVRGVGQETVLYRTEKADDPEKAALLLNIRKVVEELRRGIQSEMEANNKAKETINYFASRDPGLLQKTDLLETLSDIKDMLIEVDGKQQNLRWVESQMDELDIDIALQQFEPSVARVEKMQSLARGLKNNAVAQDFIEFKVEERSARLAALIIRELIDTHNEQRKTRRNVLWLARLGFEDRAREAYLEARSEIIQKRTRQCIFQGDLHLYIWEISFVYFTIIRNTVSCFQSCFPPVMMSACVKWAKEEVEAFNRILARQLSSTERGGEAWNKCMEQAHEHAKMLSDVSLDFRNLVGQDLLTEAPAATRVPSGPVGLGLS
ncbi:serine/threonine-protein phosphatase pp2a catalytic subunit [Niveomyces insectorum RCEF 264]|uniref:Exocyst complex component EXO84 n=1 Tax=Niveomyces insectorum RCEF 264 TaxID=1081102 RepID=A0A168A8I9_9HYPO|nr:serine/threonine-protein phosphatase pp2a catalytic subunit [Niveomyces insectorum RCEF 264]